MATKGSKKAGARERTAFALDANTIETALITGDSRGLLEDYFGADSYEQLRDLARDASKRSVRGGPRVLILPGIMGSTLGRTRLGFVEDILWLDPIEVALGRLTELKLTSGKSPYHAVGVILLAYLKLKLRLKLAGFDADFFPFDWRQSLSTLGADLATAIRKDAPKVMLVAHSMGGLVARAALGAVGQRVTRLIMLGTPNYGSFVPVQALRGGYEVVREIAMVDLRNDASTLSSEVFSTFPGLYQMLPSPEKFSGVDLFTEKTWPKSGPRPKGNLLATAMSPKLAGADARFFLIAGVNQETVVGMRVENDEFTYEVSGEGDGTVPLAFAKLAGIPEKQTYYVEASHGSLPNNGAVESAVIDLLSTGATSALPLTPPSPKRVSRIVTDRDLALAARKAVRGQLGSADYRHLLDAVAAPPKDGMVASMGRAAAGADVTGAVSDGKIQHLTIGRQRGRRLEVTLTRGSITDVDAPAYVLGVFRNVEPSGAALAIDRRLDGAISEYTSRRMITGDVGSVFTVPVGRYQVPADFVVFAGLGSFDRFTADIQELVAENVIRVLVRSRVDEFATVLMGAGSGQSAPASLRNLLAGFLRGLKDADPNGRFRGISFCEFDPDRFTEMREELLRLARTSLFENVDLALNETEATAITAPTPRALRTGREPVYTMVREEGSSKGHTQYRFSVLGSGMKAAVVSALQNVEEKKLKDLLTAFDADVRPESNFKDIAAYGRKFADLMIPAEARAVLATLKDRSLVVVHDGPSSRIPWETLVIDNWAIAVESGLSRRYLADHLPMATWLEERRLRPTLKLLLIVNPLGDLAGAEREGERIRQLTGSSIEVKQLTGKDATRAAILSELRSGQFDCVHYAGHASFDPDNPARSGLFCAEREVLRGTDLAGIANLPFLIFFNACEAGRVRGAREPKASKSASKQVFESAGVAEALMRGGVANYLSTYWPVGDNAAMTFASTFYEQILSGETLGASALAGRKAVFALKERDWADYVLYGNVDFILKQPKDSSGVPK